MTDELDFVLDDPAFDDVADILEESTTVVGRLVVRSDAEALVLNLTGIRVLSSSMLRLLIDAKTEGRAIEILNPTPEIQEALRAANLKPYLLIRGSSN